MSPSHRSIQQQNLQVAEMRIMRWMCVNKHKDRPDKEQGSPKEVAACVCHVNKDT